MGKTKRGKGTKIMAFSDVAVTWSLLAVANSDGIFRRGARVGKAITYVSRPTPPWHSRIDSGRHTLVAHRAGFMQDRGNALPRNAF